MNFDGLQLTAGLQVLHPDDERWMAYLATNQLANIFHHPAWSQLLAECYSYEPFVLVASDSQGDIQGAVPLMRVASSVTRPRLVSLPFTDHCSPLFSDHAALQRLTDGLVALSKEGRISKIDLRSDYLTLPDGCKHSDYVLHWLRLAPDEREVSNRIKPKHFRQVRVAEQRGVRVERGSDAHAVEEFYRLHLLTRRRKGVPVQPWRFFELLVQRITRRGLGFILLAYKDQECIAGAVFLHWNRTLVYKYCASIEKARHLLAVDLLLWTAIQWGCHNGYDWMDMGRTDTDDEGLRNFKRRWGAEEIPLCYCTISKHAPKTDSAHRAAMMKPIIQRSPLWVCRVTGELLYRHFG